MTIIAGFRCSDGVVICADTQETTSMGGIPLSKRNVSKLGFDEHSGIDRALAGLPELAVAFCGAGDGPFIDKLVDTAWKSAKGSRDIDQACDAIERSLKDAYEEFGRIYQPGLCPAASLIYGVKASDEARLFSAAGPIVNSIDGFHSGGCGYYMADFLASRMYSGGLTVHQGVILAAYILFQAKEHVDGCGGDSHIAVLRDSESSGQIPSHTIEAITKLVEYVDRRTGEIILGFANLGVNDNQFREEVADMQKWLLTYREQQREELEASQMFWRSLESGFLGKPVQKDALGLPVPPTPNM